MNKMFLLVAAVLAGAIGFDMLHRVAEHKLASVFVVAKDWATSTNRAADVQEQAALLRGEVLTKKQRLREAERHPGFSPELLQLLEGQTFRGSAKAWTELRQRLGIGWDASAGYVLVSRPVLKQIDYGRFVSGRVVADTVCQLLGISPEEKTVVQSILRRTTEEAGGLTVERDEPSGDIVAQCTVRPPDSAFDQSLSNRFAAGLSAAIGLERAELLLPHAWRDIRAELGPTETETLTVRKTVEDGQADLVYEMKRGTQSWTGSVRYAHYPSGWFLSVFPGGWKTLAEKEGFELPPRFESR